MSVMSKRLKKLALKLTNYFKSPLIKELEAFETLQRLDFRNFQDIEELIKTIKVGETIYANGNPSKLISVDDKMIVFETIIAPSQGFGSHWHSQEERCYILEGALVDELYPDIIYKKGEVVTFKAFARHLPANPSGSVDCLLRVEFDRA